MTDLRSPRIIVLAAGQGTRLRPLTDHKPKCLVPLLGKPILRHQMDLFDRMNLRDVVVLGGYRADLLENQGYRVVRNPLYESTNMVGTFFCAQYLMQSDGDLIISYGDIVYEPRILEALLRSRAPVSVIVDRQWRSLWSLRLDDPLSDAETLKLGEGYKLLELGKKPQSYAEVQAQYIGLIKIRADKIDALKQVYAAMDRSQIYDGKNFSNMYMTSFIQYLINLGWNVRAVPVDHGWLEVDSVEDLRRYEDMAARQALCKFYQVG